MKTQSKIYLDNAATTPLDARVVAAMQPYVMQHFGNASSLHSFGTEAKEALDSARLVVAQSIQCNADEVYFTSSGTESNNWAIKGIAFANRHRGNHIIVSAIEHDCVLNACRWLETQGFLISYIPVNQYGIVSIEAIEQLITPQTILVSVMHANNEIGSIQPIELIGQVCKSRSVYFHCDACQSFGKIPINVQQSNIDLLTINAHKIYGPKGVGALYIKKGTNIDTFLHGGGQENGLRSSTENIAGIVGFSTAISLCLNEMQSEIIRLLALRNLLVDSLSQIFEGVYFNGHPNKRLPNHVSFNIHGLEGETIRLLFLLDAAGFAVSAGSACSSNHAGGGSKVLQAIGLNPVEARGAIRVSLGRFTTEEDIVALCKILKQKVAELNPIFT